MTPRDFLTAIRATKRYSTLELLTETFFQSHIPRFLHFTVVIFLLHLGQKVFSWVIVKIIIYSLSNIIKYTMTRYFNYKNSNYHQEILQKTIQKILLGSTRVWTRDLQIVGPACYKRATQICYCREGFFILLKNVPCAQKIFVLLTSQSWKPEKK